MEEVGSSFFLFFVNSPASFAPPSHLDIWVHPSPSLGHMVSSTLPVYLFPGFRRPLKGIFTDKSSKNLHSFSYFCRQLLLVDPTEKEEIIMNGRMTMAMNIHREICGAVMGGGVSLESDQV